MNMPLYRPPAEADSLILQVDRGCPHNRCTFCGMYRGIPCRRLSLDAVRRLIRAEARLSPRASRVFLADGDVMARPFDELAAMLDLLREALPGLTRVSLYANGSSIARKSEAELRALRARGLHTLYMGLESGDESILADCHKGETATGMVQAGILAQTAGLRLSVMILLGLGGAARSDAHAERTAAAVTRMQPRLLSALRVVPTPGTPLYDDTAAGRFTPLTEWQVVHELRALIAGTALASTVFRANHASNVVPLEGRLPKDKPGMLAALDALLASRRLDRETPGPMPLWL